MTEILSNPAELAYLKKLPDLLRRLEGGLIVSCQALDDEPMHGSTYMAAMAVAAAQGGAAGIRTNSPEDIRSIRKAVKLPIIGIYKVDFPGYAVRITPIIDSAIQVAQAGADIIAIDATSRPHPDNLSLKERIRLIHDQTNCGVMADIATYREGLAAQEAGADLVSTTLSGYTADSPTQETPDFELLQSLAINLTIPVVAEGRIATPEQAARAITLGAFAVVVGSAITRPQWITAQFIRRLAQR
jgi:N-acylglucosamine-6-phosphate 2-epimerase